jgi:hypothetical protein
MMIFSLLRAVFRDSLIIVRRLTMPKSDSLDCLRVKYTAAEQRVHAQMLDHYTKFHELQRELETSIRSRYHRFTYLDPAFHEDSDIQLETNEKGTMVVSVPLHCLAVLEQAEAAG